MSNVSQVVACSWLPFLSSPSMLHFSCFLPLIPFPCFLPLIPFPCFLPLIPFPCFLPLIPFLCFLPLLPFSCSFFYSLSLAPLPFLSLLIQGLTHCSKEVFQELSGTAGDLQ